MKNLFLLRHAKSNWLSYNGNDFNRDIQKKGELRTKKICNYLKDEKIEISKVLCSSALRTRKTYEIISKSFQKKLNVEFLDELYHTTAENMLNILRSQKDEKSVMIIAHEPSLSEFVRITSSEIINESHFEAIHSYVTSGLCSILFNSESWKNISRDNSEFKFYIKPKNLD
tara:strand:+ start:565 stop:1077 length:513 start_codon:yes stop_codon:yes gene_type:complete